MTINDNATTSISNPRTLRSRLTKPLILIAGAALVAGCTSNTSSTDTVLGTSGTTGTAGVVENPESAPQITADLAGITKQNVAKIAPTRLADGLVPPTNRWFTGLVFGDQPQPVFPMPLSAALTDTGFAIGLPNVTASEKVDIRDGGSVDGDIISPRVAIAEGAHFRGSVDMQRKGSQPAQKPQAVPSQKDAAMPQAVAG